VEFDDRILRIGIEVNGVLKTYEGLSMSASGSKYANENENDCEIKITNLEENTRNYILTATSPYNKSKTPKRVIVEAGRKSWGVNTIYTGNIIKSNISQPPDLTISLKCLTANFHKGNIIARTQPPQAPLSKISKQVANDLGLTLDFQARDRQIGNYSYSGPALKQVNDLNAMGQINAYVDDDVLVVKNANEPLRNRIRVLNLETGMIGIPEFTELGINVKYMLDNTSVLGGALRVISKINPSVNGDYTISKLSFDVANRAENFYWIAEAVRR
jgi:hypothetical protein